MSQDRLELKKINVSKSEKIGDGASKNRTKEHVESKTQADEKRNQQDRKKRGEKFEQRQIQWAIGTEGRSRSNLFTLEKAVKEIERDQLETERLDMRERIRKSGRAVQRAIAIVTISSVYVRARARVRYRFSIRAHTGAHRCALSNT